MRMSNIKEKISHYKNKNMWFELLESMSGIQEPIKDLDVALSKVQALIKTRKFRDADDELKKLHVPSNKELTFLRLRYDLEFLRCNYLAAVDFAGEILKIENDNPDGHIRQAHCYFMSGDLEFANRKLDDAQNISPKNNSIRSLRNKVKTEIIEKQRKEKIWRLFKSLKELRDPFDFETPSSPGCTIVVPCYNAEKYIRQTLNSILLCGHDNIEIIAVDDFSTDKTLEILHEFVSKEKRIRLICHKKNSGSSACRNTGILNASKGFITFLDSDDLMIVGGITRRVNALKKARSENRFVIGSYGGSVTILEQVKLPPPVENRNKMKIIDYIQSDGQCPFNANQPLFLTSFLQQSGGFPEDSRTAEDWPFWIRLLRIGGVIVPTHKSDVTYRMRPGSLIRSTVETHLKNSFNIIRSSEKESELFFKKSLSEYKLQLQFRDRFFNFWGMKIASEFELLKSSSKVSHKCIEAFLLSLDKYLPDLGVLNNSFDLFKSRITQGVCRYLCVTTIDHYTKSNELKALVRGFAQGAYNYAAEKKSILLKSIKIGEKQNFDIAFFPHKEYHVRSAELIIDELEKLGLTSVIVDFSNYFGEEGVSDYLKNSNKLNLSYNEFLLGQHTTSAVAVFNDWDRIVKGFLSHFKWCGIPTIGIVEGVNDYWSIDTGVWRPAYQYVDYLFLPGNFDKRYFPNHKKLSVVGVQRLDPLYISLEKIKPTLKRNIQCVINCNFTYGVLTDKRKEWLMQICDVLISLNITPIISRHPQDIGPLGGLERYIDERSMYELINECKIFITRFSGAVYEALLSGSHVIYYNPDIERLDMFKEPMGAYSYIKERATLKNEVLKLISSPFRIDKCEAFLNYHCDYNNGIFSSSRKTALSIKNVIEQKNDHFVDREKKHKTSDRKEFIELLSKIHKAMLSYDYHAASDYLNIAKNRFLGLSYTVDQIIKDKERSINFVSRNARPNNVKQLRIFTESKCNNLFLIFSCKNYSERLDILRPLYEKNVENSDTFLFVIGDEKNNHVDGDILYLTCKDGYENLPEKVHAAIRFCTKNLNFKRLIKIDDDIYLNFSNFYKIITNNFSSDYYGRKNPPKFGYPLNKKWHIGKVTSGHKYEKSEFPIFEPAQWCSGGFYILSYHASTRIANFNETDYIQNHVYEDYMVFEILIGSGILPSFHEDSLEPGISWMIPTLKSVMDSTLSSVLSDFCLDNVVSVHCGPAVGYNVDNDKLRYIFKKIKESGFVS